MAEAEADSRPVVFYSRCRPYGIDMVDVARDNKRVFFGYVLRLHGRQYARRNLRSCIFDLADREGFGAALEPWRTQGASSPTDVNPRQCTNNFNFVGRVRPGSIALVPDLRNGIVYAGKVKGDFDLVDDPVWADAIYERWKGSPGHKRTRRDNPDDVWLAGEVAQGWEVESFVRIDTARIPAWIRRSLFGRSTYAIVPGKDLDPYPVVEDLLLNSTQIPRKWTVNPVEVRARLEQDVLPSGFEHLVVALLQLDQPGRSWMHVGGTGDGGVDGIAFDDAGRISAAVQCKWSFQGGTINWESERLDDGIETYLASLIHPDGLKSVRAQLLDRDWVIDRVIRHAERLPQAMSMRIGSRPKESANEGGRLPEQTDGASMNGNGRST